MYPQRSDYVPPHENTHKTVRGKKKETPPNIHVIYWHQTEESLTADLTNTRIYTLTNPEPKTLSGLASYGKVTPFILDRTSHESHDRLEDIAS
jgi:hypothetical protein